MNEDKNILVVYNMCGIKFNNLEMWLNHIQDILNRTLYFYQNPDGNARLDKANDPFRLSRTTGTNYGVSFSYSL